jgi:hypothetical protein
MSKEGFVMIVTRKPAADFRPPRGARAHTLWSTAVTVVLLTAVSIAHRSPHPSDIVPARPTVGASAGYISPLASPRTFSLGPLPPPAEARISAAIGEDERAYHAVAHPRGLRMENANHHLSAEFSQTGVELRHGGDHLGMVLRGYGHGSPSKNADAVAPNATANRVEYRRGALTEWYVNGPVGLEQGFTFDESPGNPNGGPLTLTLALSGDLTASVAPDARALTLTRGGTTALRYAGLRAWDADRRELRTWLEIARDELHVHVDDAGARYPLTIDPYVQAARLTTAKRCDLAGVCDDGAPNDNFGFSVGISADASTVVVGVPSKYTNSVATGAAYVFVRPSDYEGGWNSIYSILYKTKLLSSDGATAGRRLGWSVDVSRDGGTIVAGARGEEAAKGAAYVFVRPASGWDTSPVQTQTAILTPVTGSSGANQRNFGTSIAMSGDGGTVAVGATDGYYSEPGAAYVFLRPATGWVNATQTQKITSSTFSLYGIAVTLSDDATILAVGAAAENPSGGSFNFAGAAHVLARRSNPGAPDSYSDVARLVASDGIPHDYFGFSISAAGNGSAIVVGAPANEPDYVAPHAGRAYVFVRPKRGWGTPAFTITETARLTATDAWEFDHFGESVDISADGTTIIVRGVDLPSLPGTIPGPGVGYLFAKPASGWKTAIADKMLFGEDWQLGEGFADSVALSGDGRVSIIGAPFETIDWNPGQGAAYVFTGSALDPLASVSPSSLTFAPQSIGTTSNPKTVTVTNSGNGPLHVASVSATGPFASTQNCVSASPIPPGGSCAENVVFAPQSIDQVMIGTLAITDDSGGVSSATQVVPLQGAGKKADTTTTILSVSSNPVLVGAPVNVSFSVAPEPGDTLTPFGTVTVQASTGESCTAGTHANACTLIFSTPIDRTITATYNGNLDFNPSTSSSGLVRVVDLTLSALPSSQTITARKATYTLTLTAVNGFTGTVSLACAGGPPNTTCAVSPNPVNVSGSTAKPKATVTVPVGAPAGSYTITFTASFAGTTRTATASLMVN